MIKPILVVKDFGCCTTMCNQTLVLKNKFKCCFGQNLVFNLKKSGKFKNFWVLSVSSTKFPTFWLKFAKNLTPKK